MSIVLVSAINTNGYSSKGSHTLKSYTCISTKSSNTQILEEQLKNELNFYDRQHEERIFIASAVVYPYENNECELNCKNMPIDVLNVLASKGYRVVANDSSIGWTLYKDIKQYQTQSIPQLSSSNNINNGNTNQIEIRVERISGTLGMSIAGGIDYPYKANDEGIFITKLSKKGSAYLFGLKVGDKILSVNGISLVRTSHYNAVKALKSSRNDFHFTVMRKVPVKTDSNSKMNVKYDVNPVTTQEIFMKREIEGISPSQNEMSFSLHFKKNIPIDVLSLLDSKGYRVVTCAPSDHHNEIKFTLHKDAQQSKSYKTCIAKHLFLKLKRAIFYA